MGGLVGTTGWLLAWVIVNALFVVWRIFVINEFDIRDRLIRKTPKVPTFYRKRL